jgi:hypothetical protein
MLNILGSLTKNGWRETLRLLRHSENTICKQPSQPRKKYAHIRRRDGKGRKTRTAAFQLVGEEGAGAARKYRRVKDGGEVESEEVQELVLERKTVVSGDEKGQRQQLRREKDKGKGKGKARVEEREMRVGICCLSFVSPRHFGELGFDG